MDGKEFIRALDRYLATANLSLDDPARAGARAALESAADKLGAENAVNQTLADRVTRQIKGARRNPFNKFLTIARPKMRIAWSAAAQQQINPGQYESFTQNAEERNFAQDIVERVERLSYAFDRLCELGIEHFDIHEQMTQNQPSPGGIDLSRVSPSVLEREARWRREVGMVTSFVHYEIKSLVDMLKQWGVDAGSPELLYLNKTRDRFLVHPQHGGVMRLALPTISIPHDGGPVHASVAGLDRSDPITHAYYLDLLKLPQSVDHNAERLANEKTLLSRTTNEQLSPEQVSRLKAFGLRDACMEDALEELAQLLQDEVVPKIEATFDQAIRDFGFEPFRSVAD